MFRLITLVPWPVMALLSALLFWMAQDGYHDAVEFEAEKAEALSMPVPTPVAIDAFTAADVHLADEVHVTAWINTDHTYELTKQRKGIDTVRRMFVLFGPGDSADTLVARGVVVLHPDDVDPFLGQVLATADVTDPRLMFSLIGTRESSPDLSDMVNDALAERGLTKDADFLVVEPYLQGRAAALAPDPDAPKDVAQLFGVLGAIAALITLGKVLRKSRARRQAGATRSLADVEIPPPPAMAAPRLQPQVSAQSGLGYGTVPTPAVTTAWSPIAAVMAKQAALDPSALPKGYVAPAVRVEHAGIAAAGTAAPASLPRKGLVKVRNLAFGLVFYFALYFSFGAGDGPLSTASVQQIVPTVTAALAQTGWLPIGMGAAPDAASDPTEALPASLPDGAQSGAQQEFGDRTGFVVTDERSVPLPVAEPSNPALAVPLPSTPVQAGGDAPVAADGMMDGLRGLLFQASIALSAFLLTMALGLGLLRRKGTPTAQTNRDPWDRLSERLR